MSQPADPDAVPRVVLRDARLPGRDELFQLVVDGGRVVALAPTVDVGDAEIVQLEGRTVIPGLWDAHVHATQWASARHRLDLRHVESAAEAADAVRAAAQARSEDRDTVLVGVGMRHLQWQDRPHRELLDAAAPGVAVVLHGIDLHTAWLSTAALRRAGEPDHPTGLLQEADCYRVVTALPDASTAQQDAWVADAMAAAAARGVTGIRDFEFGDALLDWQRRFAQGPVDVRVATTVYADHLDAAIQRGDVTGQPVPGTGGHLTSGHLKLFVDGALNSRTALCDHPYGGDAAGGHGELATSPDELVGLMTHAWTHGIASAVHAIGDRAVRIALDAFDVVGCPGRIEHAQLVATQDLGRFARAGLVASVQPAHAHDDRDVAERLWPGQTDRAFPLADLLAAGGRLEFGSDAPVSPLDPWAAIDAAVRRTDDGRPPWHAEQCIDVATALAASAGGRDRVRLGDEADLAVLDDDPLRCAPSTLRAPSVWATMLAGRWTHRTW